MSSKKRCVPFFVTKILQQETVNDLKSHWRKSQVYRRQSSELGSDDIMSAQKLQFYFEEMLE